MNYDLGYQNEEPRGQDDQDTRHMGNGLLVILKKRKYTISIMKTGAFQCQIDEIIRAGHARIFNPDTLAQAHSEEYDNCAYCIGGSKR